MLYIFVPHSSIVGNQLYTHSTFSRGLLSFIRWLLCKTLYELERQHKNRTIKQLRRIDLSCLRSFLLLPAERAHRRQWNTLIFINSLERLCPATLVAITPHLSLYRTLVQHYHGHYQLPVHLFRCESCRRQARVVRCTLTIFPRGRRKMWHVAEGIVHSGVHSQNLCLAKLLSRAGSRATISRRVSSWFIN